MKYKRKNESQRKKWILFSKVADIGKNTVRPTRFDRTNASGDIGWHHIGQKHHEVLNQCLLIRKLFVSRTPMQLGKHEVISQSEFWRKNGCGRNSYPELLDIFFSNWDMRSSYLVQGYGTRFIDHC
ncbi:hypothetical protein TNCT_654761 [Trichonephila clavata]|uniref:Uncharacterized protein n=1 Tax=Trichonephila clavata TaxID=2740835 RepID=A0A8X6G2T9_TRICU|nr:hypothetical protein TNCT_654761 [Trichonephila clavata]